MNEQMLKQIYKVFAPAPLEPDDDDLYVDLDVARGNLGTTQRMTRNIRLSDNKTCQILTGHGGSGYDINPLIADLPWPPAQGSAPAA